jgi:hypothetical protein
VKVNKDDAVKCFRSWLQRLNPPLESIELELETCLGEADLMPDEAEKLLEVVCTKVSLRSLKLYDRVAVYINVPLCSLTNLTSLELRCHDLGRIRLDSVLLLTQLRHLKLHDTYLGGDPLTAFVRGVASSLLHLTTLELCTDLIKPQQLLPLTSLRGLEELGLSHMGVEAAGIAVLSQLPITSIMVRVTAGAVGEVCSWLQTGGSKIISLELSGRSLPPRLSLPEVELLVSQLRTWAPQVRSLSISDMAQLNYSTGLPRLTQLTRLEVFNCDLNDAALLRLSALTGLRALEIRCSQVRGGGGSFEGIASSLQQLTYLGFQDSLQAEMAARRAFGSRVIYNSWKGLMLRPGVPTGD